MACRSVYLDHNATTPCDERVVEAMMPYFSRDYGNASSQHLLGRHARAAIDQAREQVAELVSAHPTQVVFTSGGTEANNMIIAGQNPAAGVGRMAVSAIEHASLLAPARQMARYGWTVEMVPVDQCGRLDVEEYQAALQRQPRLVSVMLANNETGVIQDVASLARLAREAGVIFHTDAVQALGKVEVDFPALGAHLMTLSSHKIYGPKGCGALVIDKAVDLSPLLCGGGQEKGRRAGTENVAAIVGFGKAAEIAKRELAERNAQLLRLRNGLEQGLQRLPGVTLFSSAPNRLPNTVFFAVEKIDGETLMMNLDAAGFALSSGSACESGSGKPSHVLRAMGFADDSAQGAIRVSFGKDNSEQDVDDFLTALGAQIDSLRRLGSCLAV
ncbi:MAG: cysteine desulfurase family protein [Pseudomonadota bacterium]